MQETMIPASGYVMFSLLQERMEGLDPDLYVVGSSWWARPVVGIVSRHGEEAPELMDRQPLIVSEHGAIQTPGEYLKEMSHGAADFVRHYFDPSFDPETIDRNFCRPSIIRHRYHDN